MVSPNNQASSSSYHPRRYGNRLIECCITVLLVLLGMLGSVDARSTRNHDRVLCSQVHSRCFGRNGCRFALENYFMSCLDLSDGQEFQCTERCKEALIMLLSSDEHDGPNAFRDCDCQDDEFCQQQKERIAVCADDVQTWLTDINDPDTPISCSLAEKICSADTPCLTAIEYYQSHCKKLFEQRNPRCTSRCNNSLNILYRQTKAQKLRTCVCNGREMYNCTTLKDNTQTLCYGAVPTLSPQNNDTSTRPIRHPHTHNHTRPCIQNVQPTQKAPTDSNSYDSITKDSDGERPGSTGHNSAYTLNSRACTQLRALNSHVVVVLLGYVLALWCHR